MKWVSLKERLPTKEYGVYLKYIYQNGNSGRAIGYLNDDGEWEIEWSDDHPQPEDIKFWLEDSILHVHIFGDLITLEMIDEGIKKRVGLFGDKDYPILADIRNSGSYTRGARSRLAQKDGGTG